MVDAAQASSTEPAGIQMDTLTRDGRAKDRPVSRAPSVSSASTFVEQPQPAGPGAGARERRSSFTSVPLNDVPTPRELEQQRPRRRIRYRTQVLSTSTTEISRKRGIFASISLLCIVAAALFIAIFFLYSIVNLRMDVNWLSDKLEFLNNQILQSIGGVPAVYNNTGTVPQNLTELIIETIDSKANKTTALLMPPPQMTPGTPKFQPPVQSGDATPHGYQRSGGAVSQYTSVEVPAATGLVDVVTSDVKLNTLNKREQLLYWDDNFYGNSATKGREMLEALEAGKRHSPIFKNLDHLEKASWSITANPPGQNLADPGPMLEKSLERFASNGRFFWEWLAGPKDPSKEVYGLAQDYFRLLLHPGDGIFSAYHYGGFNALEEDLIRFSDVGFIGWQYVCEKEEMKLNGLRYFLYTSVGDWDFVELWETILEQEDIEPIEYPGHTFSMDEEAGQAILGTPYGQALATMLIQHKNAFEGMNIKSVTVCDTQESGGRPDLWFELTGPTTPSPTLNSATPAEQSVRTSNKPNTFDEYLRIGKLLLDHMKPGSHLPEDPQEMRASDIDMWVVDGLNVPFGYKWTKSDYNVHKGEFKTFVRLIPFQKISDSPKDLMGSFNGGYSVWKGGCEQEGIDPTTMKYLSLWTGSEKDIIPKILDHSRLSNKDIPYEGGHDFGMDTKTGQAMLGAYPHVGDLVLRHFPTKTIEAVKIYWTPKGEHLDCWFILADKEPPHPTQPSSPPLSFQKIELKP